MARGSKDGLIARLDDGVSWLVGLIVLVWLVQIVNLLSGNQLIQFGILPRNPIGLRGIVFAPFLHSGLAHAIANTVPLLVLGALVFARGKGAFLRAWIAIALVGGGLTWLLGRPAFHVGASGIIFGFLGFLVIGAWLERKLLPILLGLAAAVLYGGALWGLLPLAPGVSWESHLFGFCGGGLAARLELLNGRKKPDTWSPDDL